MFLTGCSGSRKYFKAAERLEKQGLVDEAADYYLESLIRKPTNVEARIKLKEVGQKYVSSLSSEFFREYNTQQIDASLVTFERLKAFHERCASMNVHLDYPSAYNDDYQKQVEIYCAKNYAEANQLVRQKKYREVESYIQKVKKYKPDYRNLHELEIVASCEPLYQNAISSLESKNYNGAYNLLLNIKSKTENYKDLPDLLQLATDQQTKSFILFEPRAVSDKTTKDIAEELYASFSQSSQQQAATIKIINNSPFQGMRGATDLTGSTNLDLVQAIRKATGADYFYMYDLQNRRELAQGPIRAGGRGYQEIHRKKGEETVIEYQPFDFNNVKANRTYQYEFRYRLINAHTNQIVSSGTEIVRASDAIEYNEFTSPTLVQKLFGKTSPTSSDINSLYPYNPITTPPAGRINARNWRTLFSARASLKSFDELRLEAMKNNVNLFNRVFTMMK